MKISTFTAGDNIFSVPIVSILEIKRVFGITKVYGAPPEIEGLINLRGRIYTSFNLSLCIGNKRSEQSAQTRVIFFKTDKELNDEARELDIITSNDNMALVVDSVGEVVDVEESEIGPVPAHSNHPYFRGVIQKKEYLYTLLYLEELFKLSKSEI